MPVYIIIDIRMDIYNSGLLLWLCTSSLYPDTYIFEVLDGLRIFFSTKGLLFSAVNEWDVWEGMLLDLVSLEARLLVSAVAMDGLVLRWLGANPLTRTFSLDRIDEADLGSLPCRF